ncbi:MAG: hypothetical protein PHZ09_08035, partial [Eubacteriales bacterium]|nr:hypothetical protein [Eubacteriales bacterium]
NIFHYNTQLSTFPLEAANHPELLETYYNYRISQLPAAREYAAKHKGKSGAFYTDVSDFMGRMQPQEFNCTCGAQIAMALYDHYRYSNDEMYLRRILPVMHSVGEFYIDMLTMGDDGYYHIHNTLGYEGSPMLDDSITDLAMIRILFAALIKHLPEDEGALFAGRLERLTPYETADFVGGEVENGIFLHGIGKGKAIFCDNVLSVGRLSGNGRIMRKTHGLKELDYYGFPDTEMAPVFPSGNVGLKDKESVIFKQIKNSVCLHHPAIPEDAVSEGEEFDGMCMGWCLMPVYMARLGMAEELQKQLYDSVSTWCAYPNGMSMEGPYENFNPDINMRWKKYRFGEVSDGRKAGIYSWNFRHFNYEALPIMSAAVNEMLLQSYDGIIRILPAMDKNADVRYSLAAVGGYKVDLRCRDGIYDIYISAKRDGECKIALPDFESKPIFENAADRYKYSYKLKGDIYIITLREGDILRIYCASCDDPAYDKLSYTEDFKRNEDVKFLGNAMLGEEKTF